MKNTKAGAVLPWITVIVLIAVSVQLVLSKRQYRALDEELIRAIRPFVIGAPVGPASVSLADGGTTTLERLCPQTGSTVVVLSANYCQTCRVAETLAARLAERPSGDLTGFVLYLDGWPAEGRPASGRVDAREVVELLGVSELPATMLLDDRCRLVAGGVGASASRRTLALAESRAGAE